MQRKEQTKERNEREILLRKLRQLSDNYDRLLKAYDEILHETWSESFEASSGKGSRSCQTPSKAKKTK